MDSAEMDLIPPPTKPPRGVKNAKETSGLLINVMRTLSKSDSNEQREQVRIKLEKDFKESNIGLQELVSIHHDELTKVMNLFGELSSSISRDKLRIHNAHEKIIASKELFTCRREELRKSYLESVEYKQASQLYEEITQMKNVPSQLVSLTKKDYLKATKLLVSAVRTAESDLGNVIGLHELRSELLLKKQELCTELVAEMKEQIYVHGTREIIALRRQGSARDSVDQLSPSDAQNSERKTPLKRSQFRSAKSLDVPGTAKQNKIPKNNVVEFSDDVEFVISNLIECVILLDKVPVLIEELKQITQRELKDLTVRTTKDLSTTDSPNILLEFLQIITEQFKRILDTHKFILETLKTKQCTNSVYDLRDVWLKIQNVLQQLLCEYLDVDNLKKIEQSTVENAALGTGEQYDISSYFTRKKHQRAVKGSLFKFVNSSQTDGSHSISKFYEEGNTDKQLLCKPSPSHITQIFVPLSQFSEDVEQMLNGGPSEQSSKLSIFLNDFVGKVFLGKRYEEIVGNIPPADKDGVLTSPYAKDLNGTVQNTPSPLLTVSKSKRKRSLLFL